MELGEKVPDMMLGPIEVVVIEFEGNRFKGEIAPALAEVVGKGIVRIIDLVFVMKDQNGSVRGLELDAAEADVAQAMYPLTDDVMGLLSEQDVQQVGAELRENTSAALIVFEHRWAARLREAIINANGRVVAQERVPADAVERALEAQAAGPA
jgi:uncharacterized protein DUF6325